MRITQGMLSDQALGNLQSLLAQISTDSQQLSTQRKLNAPSDDPTAVRTAMGARDSLGEIKQYLRNIDVARRDYDSADSALGSVQGLLSRVKELAVQGGNDTLSANDRVSIARELEAIQRSLVSLANTRVGDKYLFSGYQTSTAPYAEPPPASATVGPYAGDTGVGSVRIAPGQTVQRSLPGSALFTDVFASVAAIHADLMAGKAPSAAALSTLGIGTNTIADGRAQYGAFTNRADQAGGILGGLKTAQETLLSQLEDVDLSSAITAFQRHQAAYQAALQVNAKVLMPNLFSVI